MKFEEDREKIYDLFDRAVKDYLCKFILVICESSLNFFPIKRQIIIIQILTFTVLENNTIITTNSIHIFGSWFCILINFVLFCCYFIAIDVWLEYCQYSVGALGSPEGMKEIRDTFELAVTAGGLHVTKGANLWEVYREFENALLMGMQVSCFNFGDPDLYR